MAALSALTENIKDFRAPLWTDLRRTWVEAALVDVDGVAKEADYARQHLHLVEISVWGLFYFWSGFLPDAESALYFSGVTYMTVGYGDLILPKPWRMVAPLEALTGILMCELSTGLFFAVVSRWISNWMQGKPR